MTQDGQNGAASGIPGSAAAPAPASSGQAGAGAVDAENLVRENENLQKVLGKQGEELGEYRKFIEAIEPLAKKLEANPEVYDLIMSDKLTDEVAKLVAEGKVSEKEAKDVVAATAEVKKDAGVKLNQMTAEEVSRLVEEKLQKMQEAVGETVKAKVDEFRGEQEVIQDAAEFIEKTKDFSEYAEEIDKYLAENDETDVSRAYYLVKGRILTEKAAEDAEVKAAEIAKNVAVGSAPGGAPIRRGPINNKELSDSLFAQGIAPSSLL